MCQSCGDDREKGGGKVRRPISRRAMLALGASVTAGAVLGLWSCQNGPNQAQPGARGTKGPTDQPDMASGRPQVPVGDAQAKAQQSTATEPDMQAAESAPANRHATPDLGVEVFPDLKGNAIAHPADAPVIVVPRTDWAHGDPRLAEIEPMGGVQHITVHHTAMGLQTDAWQPTASELETIREFHAGSRPTDRHWADIAYHFAVDRAGRVWQARPLGYQGAHVKGHNEHNLGIVLMGNFDVQSPSAAQLTSLSMFIGFVRKLYDVPLNEVFTHGELGQTECPGKELQAYMNRCRGDWAQDEGIAWQPISRPAGARAMGRSGSV